eukprot:TRINITY_DN1249_c0_g1_i1.p1 TRINITY_DN1249_c0_g1~~TRINITY_DN1249_c0_g1_i1.p1  ORF type:complete len:633 (+),score=125.88 TRINITY_DN1249_c0_g1_i1:1566-3464(+)
MICSWVGTFLSTGSSSPDSILGKALDVGTLIGLFCGKLEEQISSRTYFYKNSKLITEGLILLIEPPFKKSGDLLEYCVEIDRRLLDYVVGLDTELSDIIDGGDLYSPTVKLQQVMLPQNKKDLIVDTISNVEKFKVISKKLNFNETFPYGIGMCFLFYGSPGTGKTMMANAITNYLGKKLLVVNVPSIGGGNGFLTKEMLRFIFREAKIHNAIIFFDECESLFESRNNVAKSEVTSILTEIERYDGIIILATNRAYDLDEAMHRRITVAIEFNSPDFALRKEIWKSHVPKLVHLDDDVDWDALAMDYELTGGFIKNAMLHALSSAIARGSNYDDEVVEFSLNHNDLTNGAKLQLRGHLRLAEIDRLRRIIPVMGIDQLVLYPEIISQLQQIIGFEKAKKLLYGHWGFSNTNSLSKRGTVVLLTGREGTGKSSIAEALGYEIGRPLKEINCGEFISGFVRGTSRSIELLFKDAKSSDAVLVFDNASLLFGATSYTTSVRQIHDVSIIVYHISRYPGLVVLSAESEDDIDMSLFKNIDFKINIPNPDLNLRKNLWKKLIPEKAPTEGDINFKMLAKKFSSFSGGDIRKSILRAAEMAALRIEGDRVITESDIIKSAEKVLKLKVDRKVHNIMFT